MTLEPEELEEQSNVVQQPQGMAIYKPHTTLFTDPTTKAKHVILTKHSPNPIAENILNYLDSAGFANVLNIGVSGSGKTTWTNYLIHLLHMKRNFRILWFRQEEVKKFDKIITSIPKGVNHILVFDDVSFELDELRKDELTNIAKKLTYIRHIVQADVVVVFNIHYSKAIKKFFRSTPFTFLTSINNEEILSFQDLFGSYSRYKLKDFARYSRYAMLKKGWTMEIDRWENKALKFTTDKPFRIGLANEYNDLHFFLYVNTHCEICKEPDNKKRSVYDSKSLLEYLTKSYSLAKVRTVIRDYSFTNHGLKVLPNEKLTIWNTLSKLDRENNIDFNELNNLLDDTMKIKRPRNYLKNTDTKRINEELGIKNS